jgi:two-component system, chemotaxis family, chemotaxis protein CheY
MKTIIIIDDSTTTRELVKTSLEEIGFSVDTAVDGVEGLNLIRNNHYDLIITDINMPVMDGFELTQEVRKLTDYQFTPLLILTTESDLDKKMTGKEVGATGWLVKPIIPEQLVRTIKRFL